MELKSARGTAPSAPRDVSPDVRPAAKSHQGTIFFRPFFFLLVDSFLLLPFVPLCGPSGVAEPSILGVSELCPPATGVASVLNAMSAVPAAVVPPVEFSAADGAFGSGCAAGFASLAPAAGATPSAPPVVALVLPGVIVATIPVPEPPIRDWLPPAKTSIPASLSDSGVIVGFPFVAAVRNSFPGPLRISSSGFLMSISRCRGAFCSAVIQATAWGSGCGTDAPSAFNRLVALGTKGGSDLRSLLAWIPQPSCLLSRSSSNQCGSHLPPAVPALRANAVPPSAPADR